MRKFWRVLLVAVLAATAFSFIVNSKQQAETEQQISAGKIEQIELAANGTGWARTSSVLWRTNDSGKSWQEITPPKSAGQRLSGISFVDNNGFVVLTNGKSFELARTNDGGNGWTKQNLPISNEILSEAAFDRVLLNVNDSNSIILIVRLASSSNFTRAAIITTADGFANLSERTAMEKGEVSLESFLTKNQSEPNDKPLFDAPLIEGESVTAIDFANTDNGFILVESGRCGGFKSGCEQSARILATTNGGKNWEDVTPELAKAAVKLPDLRSDSQNSLSPGGSTRTSINRGFDKCTAAPASQMQTWWNESPFYDANIYMSGRNRGCTQPQLTSAWINQVSAQGWGLIPTIVGYQSPCLQACPTCARFSTDPATAETQGRGEADIAITDANNLGLTTGTVLYYDMERYDGDMVCRTATNAFLKGWTDRLHELGYLSGTYGSPTNAAADWVNIPAASRMDAVWMARWDNIGSTWFYASPSPQLPNNLWTNHNRIKQFQAPHNETWGGVTFNIDGNISDAPVAGVRAPKNKPADFDGDGKSDIAVYRPNTGNWFWINSANSSFNTIAFGSAEDKIVPGDYDGDGRTDIGVFRPSSGMWYQYSVNPARPNAAVIRSRQWGASGDIPAAADYDGNGMTDLAVFRNGGWYITYSFDPRDPQIRSEAFGTTGDLPVPGDYDGDGKADIAVFRPDTGAWYISRSSQGFIAVGFGASGDKPVQGDYDGDGKTDIAVYRPSNGGWYLLQSTAGFSGMQFGIAADQPAPGDFDGDGKTDIAVFRPENGIWYIQQSQAGFTSIQFGANGDKPVEAGYVP